MGRRALASALDLAGELIYEQQSEARKRRQRAAELEIEFDQKRRLMEYESVLKGQGAYDPQTGVFTRTPFDFDSSTLGEGESATIPLPGGGSRTYRGLGALDLQRQQQQRMAGALAPLPTVTPPGGRPQEGFAPSEVGHPQTQELLQRRVGAMQQVGLAPKPVTSRSITQTEEFRQAIQDAIAAVSMGLPKEEAIQRLLDAYPDKASAIQQLEYSVF